MLACTCVAAFHPPLGPSFSLEGYFGLVGGLVCLPVFIAASLGWAGKAGICAGTASGTM